MKKLFLIAYLIFISPAHANAIPDFDIDAYCKSVADISGGSAKIERECQKMENAEKVNISRLNSPPNTVSYCKKMANFGETSYVFYAKCLKIELEALEVIGQ